MKKSSFFKITSLSMFALLSVFSYQSAVAEYTDEATTEAQYEVYGAEAVAEAVVEEAEAVETAEEAPVCYDENNEEISCDVATEAETVSEEASVCYNENNEEVPCE